MVWIGFDEAHVMMMAGTRRDGRAAKGNAIVFTLECVRVCVTRV